MRQAPTCLRLAILFIIAAVLAACAGRGSETPAIIASPPTPPAVAQVPVIAAPTALATSATAAPTPTAASDEPPPGPATPFYTGPLSPPCGLLLSPTLPLSTAAPVRLNMSDDARANLRQLAPAAAWPALQRLLDAPGTVGLVAFQAGREAVGVYLNADAPMPLASVAKLIVLVAYAEAIAAGELNPLEQVPLDELDRYYLPNFDLGAHRRAVAELRDLGRVVSPHDNPTVSLDDIAWMMIRHSSNAASDYLHLRLGQSRVEETAVALGLNEPPHRHSAPCTFLGQFLLMGNHTRSAAGDRAALSALVNGDAAGAEAYGREIALLADAYVNDEAFRAAEREWRSMTRGPAIETQRTFAASLGTRGTAGAYASLLLRLAQNGLSNPDSSYQARRILEWTNLFEANQEIFSNVGYKNGSLPGVLTTTYYAYRWGEVAPVVVILFYRDLPQQTYRQWRDDLPHDELARWLLADPTAIPALSSFVSAAAGP